MSAEFSAELVERCLNALRARLADMMEANKGMSAERDVLRAQNAELQAALKEIARQKLAVEMDEADGGDWDGGEKARKPTDAEFAAEAERLFDCAHNNMGWRPIEQSLRGAFERGQHNAAHPAPSTIDAVGQPQGSGE